MAEREVLPVASVDVEPLRVVIGPPRGLVFASYQADLVEQFDTSAEQSRAAKDSRGRAHPP
ncbi:hypothetical protein [Streptomyces sp. NPDC058297]|uniref:hypothetical protein n=1 Tax=Streptomyces sp. NPDC058297 TaxID=3346433 RepID=UPI0036E617BD